MNTLQFQERWPDLHSDKVRRALRCLPADVAVAMPDEWLDATVRQIAAGMDEIADIVRKHQDKYNAKTNDPRVKALVEAAKWKAWDEGFTYRSTGGSRQDNPHPKPSEDDL